MDCPRCGDPTGYKERTVRGWRRCGQCAHHFREAPRQDVRVLLRQLLTDDLFSCDQWKCSTTLERVRWLVQKVKELDDERPSYRCHTSCHRGSEHSG